MAKEVDLDYFNPDWNYAEKHGLALKPGKSKVILENGE
jgi:hypothetical protein